jgi:UDP-N-acetylglucosamine--N-acetylmuramyl-(pentapeptide) pyrophosphoryl-undecaprenol N-acetylglucosamine transferase
MPKSMATYRVLMAAGGTGGHVYPAIAIADALKAQGSDMDIRFVGTKNHMEWTSVPKAGYEITPIWISGLQRRLTPKNVLFPIKLLTALVQSYWLLRSFRPSIVISCGGYVAGPVGWVAAKLGIPIMIQEQNSYPGVTNRMLARYARRIFTAFPDAQDYFPEDRVRMVGNPTRNKLRQANAQTAREYFRFTEDRPVLLVLGGSLGAKSINQAMRHSLDTLHDIVGLQIIWQCGKRYIDDLEKDIDVEDYPRLRLHAYLDDMPAAYAAADLAVSRAGASSCSELMITGTPSVLVPSPHVAGDHQTMNARSMQEQGASEILEDDSLQDTLSELVTRLLADHEQLRRMNDAALAMAKPMAAQDIAEEIRTTIETSKQVLA